MSLDLHSSTASPEYFDPEFEAELDRPWAETVVTATAAALTVLVVSSVAVVMYLA